jgi:hypothetical protein
MRSVLDISAADLQQHTREDRWMRVLLPMGVVLAAAAGLFVRFRAAGQGSWRSRGRLLLLLTHRAADRHGWAVHL